MLSTALKNGILIVLIILIIHFLLKQAVGTKTWQTFVVGGEEAAAHSAVDVARVVQEEHVAHVAAFDAPQTAVQAEEEELYKYLFATKPFADTPAPALEDAQPPPVAVAAPLDSPMFKDISGIDEGENYFELS